MSETTTAPTPAPAPGVVTPANEAERQEQSRKQKDLLTRLTVGPNTRAARNTQLSTNSKLTTDEHVGKGAEPHKDRGAEALKVGSPHAGVELKTQDISTHESGKATDTVVLSPRDPGAGSAPSLHKQDAIGTSAVVAEANGGEEAGAGAPDLVGDVKTHQLAPDAPNAIKKNGPGYEE